MTNFQGHLPKTALTHPRLITQTGATGSSNKIDYSNGKTTTIKKRRLRKVRYIVKQW